MATFTGLAAAVIVVVSLFVWPGFLQTPQSCATPGTLTEFTNGRTYCYRTVPLPVSPPPNPNGTYTNWTTYTLWGLTFALVAPPSVGVGRLDVRISEPLAGTFSDNMTYGGYHPSDHFVVSWFTPDGWSGVVLSYTYPSPLNVSLLVQS